MSTSLTDGANSNSHAYQHGFQPPQAGQAVQQTNGQPSLQMPSTQSSDSILPSSKVKQELTNVKSEHAVPGHILPQQLQKAIPAAAHLSSSPPVSAQPFSGQPGQQPAPAASGPYHAHPSLVNSTRVVADYTGPGQLQAVPQSGLLTGPPYSQPEYSQQGPSQSLSMQHGQTGNPGGQVGGVSAAGGYPLQSQGISHAQRPMAESAGPANGKQVSTSDIQQVQNYIEKCLQMYLTQKEVINQLQQQFKIEPCFTQLVWQKLEEQNQEFFRAYYTRLKLKDQIVLFNHLLDEQVKMFERLPRSNLMPATGSSMLAGHAAIASNTNAQPLQPGSQMQAQLASQSTAGGMSQPSGLGQAAPVSDAPMGLQGDAHQLYAGDFPGLGMDGGNGDLNPDLAALAQSLPFSGSEMNLAGMVHSGSIGRGLGSHDHLAGLPRNFSLSDLALDNVMDGEHAGTMPRNISLSDFPGLDLDSGGEQG